MHLLPSPRFVGTPALSAGVNNDRRRQRRGTDRRVAVPAAVPSCCDWCTFRYASKCMQCMAVNISHHSLPSPLYALVSSTTDTDRVASGVWPTQQLQLLAA